MIYATFWVVVHCWTFEKTVLLLQQVKSDAGKKLDLTEISAVVLNFLPRSKILNRPKVSTHYRIQKFVNKICLHKLIVEIMLFVYIFVKFRNRLIKVKKIQKIISRHKFIVRSWFLVVLDPKINIWKFVSIFGLHLCQKGNK